MLWAMLKSMAPSLVIFMPKKLTNSAAPASVRLAYALSQYAKASLSAGTISALVLRVFSISLETLFPSAATPQNSYWASATWANNWATVRTSLTGWKDHISSGILSTEPRISPLEMLNIALETVTSGFAGVSWADATA